MIGGREADNHLIESSPVVMSVEKEYISPDRLTPADVIGAVVNSMAGPQPTLDIGKTGRIRVRAGTEGRIGNKVGCRSLFVS